MMCFNISVNKLSNQTGIFLYLNIPNKKTGEGPGGTEEVIHRIWKYLKKSGGRGGETGRGDETNANIAKILQKEPVCWEKKTFMYTINISEHQRQQSRRPFRNFIIFEWPATLILD